jgi:hypothetical protein
VPFERLSGVEANGGERPEKPELLAIAVTRPRHAFAVHLDRYGAGTVGGAWHEPLPESVNVAPDSGTNCQS